MSLREENILQIWNCENRLIWISRPDSLMAKCRRQLLVLSGAFKKAFLGTFALLQKQSPQNMGRCLHYARKALASIIFPCGIVFFKVDQSEYLWLSQLKTSSITRCTILENSTVGSMRSMNNKLKNVTKSSHRVVVLSLLRQEPKFEKQTYLAGKLRYPPIWKGRLEST